MKKNNNFAEDKLKNLFDNNSYAKFEISQNLENKIDNLSSQKHIPLYRKKAFLSVAATCCILITYFAFISPVILSGKNSDSALYDNIPQNEAAENNSNIFSIIQNIIENDFTAKSDAASGTGNFEASTQYDKIIISSVVEFTALSDNSISFIEDICGTGELQIIITEFQLYTGDNLDLSASMIIFSGTKGNYYCIGNNTDIDTAQLQFSSSNSLDGVYPALSSGEVLITANKVNGIYSLETRLNSNIQKTYTMKNDSLNDISTEKEYSLN